MEPLWYIEALPIERITVVTENSQMLEWFLRLKDDIEERGLMNPILVNNRQDKPYRVRAGNNRLQACTMLGYTHIPALSFGKEPDVDAKLIHTLPEAQELMKDGILAYSYLNGRIDFKINSAMVPEHMKYPSGL